MRVEQDLQSCVVSVVNFTIEVNSTFTTIITKNLTWLVAVVTPEIVAPPVRAILPKEMSESSATDTPLEAAVVVTFVPPVTENTSDKKSMSSEPESPVTVIPEPTAGPVVVPVIRPLASNVMIGIAVAEPTVAPVTTSLSLASGTVPEARSEASRLVRFAPLIAGRVRLGI